MAVFGLDAHTRWQRDYNERVNPQLMTQLLHASVPVLQWTGWHIESVDFGACTSVLPLAVETTNQHGTHQAALISLSADYTGGMALATLLTGVPLTGIHRSDSEEAASLWLVGMDVRYENPSTGHLIGRCHIEPKIAERIRSRFFSGKVALASLTVEFISEDGEPVASASMKYFAQATKKLLAKRENGQRSPLAKLNLKKSARIIAGLRAMQSETRDAVYNADNGSVWRFDASHDHCAAGTHGMLQATRLKKVLPQLSTMVAARTRHGDEAVRRRNGLEQVVFLGSGLDMRVLRMNRLLAKTTVFELDLPEMLEERQKVIERLRRRGDASGKLPERHLIASDFLVDDLAKQLREHPAFSETAHTFVFYEGCSMYFDESDNRKILASIRSVLRHPDSRIWMDCVTPEVIGLRTQDPNIHEFVQRMELLGERFIYGPSDPEKLLADCGLVTETNVTAAEYLGSADPTMGEYRFLVAKRDVLDLHR